MNGCAKLRMPFHTPNIASNRAAERRLRSVPRIMAPSLRLAWPAVLPRTEQSREQYLREARCGRNVDPHHAQALSDKARWARPEHALPQKR